MTERLAACYTGAVYDVMRETGYPNCVLPHEIRPLDDSKTLAGPIWTCSGRIDESISDDESLMGWTGLLSAAPAGTVLVCQPNDSTIAHMGELSAETLNHRGVLGYVVDGGNRDSEFIRKLGWPVFFRYFTPKDVVGKWKVESMGEPIVIGDIDISSGDWILADIDGVVVIPQSMIDSVVTRTEEIMSTESELRTMILNGMDPKEAYKKYRLF
ncbi:MAG TPA: methyltransferase [Dehalococcoidia bacterium]|nr:methyltransferase [Chloroflexota bacterium]HCI86784.1 methyltransferase [Dehalococcoidia bacterium]|tara:strand:+ start:500 stop:1138 length:639 start_codon:yes stop_codon:yes gene_type:complete